MIAVVLCVIFLKKPYIYGTWVDEQGMIAFTFEKNGNLRVSGKNNILGADLFQFTEDKEGNLTLQAKEISGDMISLNMKYELSEDMLDITVLGQNFTLYRTDEENIILECWKLQKKHRRSQQERWRMHWTLFRELHYMVHGRMKAV